MEQSWYQLRIPTFVLAMVVLCVFVAKNARNHDDGIVRVYLTENHSLCVAYRAWLRGWPETYSVRYELDEENTTTLGYPKRKYIEDKFIGRSLFVNVGIALAAMLAGIVITEGGLRLFSRNPKAAPDETSHPAVAAAEVPAAVADTPAPRGRPITTRRNVSGKRPTTAQERRQRPVSVKPAIAPQRIAALKRAIKK